VGFVYTLSGNRAFISSGFAREKSVRLAQSPEATACKIVARDVARLGNRCPRCFDEGPIRSRWRVHYVLIRLSF
jgi:hypothetical protein